MRIHAYLLASGFLTGVSLVMFFATISKLLTLAVNFIVTPNFFSLSNTASNFFSSVINGLVLALNSVITICFFMQ